MASVDNSSNNPNDPNNPNNVSGNLAQPGQTNQPATTSGGGPVTATGAGNVTGQVVGTANPSQPFQNISSYLTANAPQSKDLANQVAGTVSKPIDEAKTGITDAATNFTGQVNAGYAPENKDLITAVSENPAYVVAESPDNVTNFLGQLNNTYKGPTDFTQGTGYSDLQAKIAQAQSQASNTGSEAGIQSLLKSVEGPTTAGINKLDSLLLSANPENYKTIQDSGKGATELTPLLNQTASDQNALAAGGAKTAAQTAQEALAALESARGAEGTNLNAEQGSIQDIVNQYNKSVGIINPVVQNITQAIQDFLTNNPNVQIGSGGDPLADIKNLTSIVMPEMASYASPEDYAQIAALTQLGDKNVGNLPIGSSTASQAQSFNLPTQLQDVIGKAPGVEKALQDQLMGFGNSINSAVAPYQALMDSETRRADVVQKAEDLTNQIQPLQKQVADMQQKYNVLAQPNSGASPSQQATAKAALDEAQARLNGMQSQLSTYTSSPDYHVGNYWDQIGQMAQGLQWVNGTETSYQQLVDAINGELGKLGNVGVPNLKYGPNAAAPVAKSAPPIGVDQAAKIAATGTQVGAPIAAALGGGAAAANAIEAANIAQGGFGEGLATSGAEGAEAAAEGTAGLQAGLTAVAPAALAAYGASNIVKNSAANPIKSGIATLANTGLSLATLSLPPSVFNSIGKDIDKVVHNIKDFFGGLF